jgi:hypothetical protein
MKMSDEKAVALVGTRGIEVKTAEDLKTLAATVIASKLAPAGIETPAQAFIAMQTGLEAGFTPMQGLRAVAVIGNRPSWLGKAALALVRQRGMLKQSPTKKEVGSFEPEKKGLARYTDTFGIAVTVWRVGDPEPHTFTYTVDDAKVAGLWNPSNPKKPWATAPKRMLYWRAIGEAMDVLFSDVLLGLPLMENAQDFEDERGWKRARVVNPEDKGEANAADAADPLLEHFEKQVAEEQAEAQTDMAAEIDPKIDEAEIVEPPSVEEALGSQAVASHAKAGGEMAPEKRTCVGNDHDWIFEGDPSGDAEPVIVCRDCGVLSEQGAQPGQGELL